MQALRELAILRMGKALRGLKDWLLVIHKLLSLAGSYPSLNHKASTLRRLIKA
jgi:hypothetical protein